MGRVTKKTSAAAVKEVEDSPTITQSRTRRTPKPNPKYNSESIIAPSKHDEDEADLSEEGEEGLIETKVAAKSAKKPIDNPASVKGNKTLATKGKGGVAKKQKLEFDDEDDTEDADEHDEEKVIPVTRATRSGRAVAEVKVGDDSVAIVDVSSIIGKAPTQPDSPKNTRGGTRKRAVPEESPKEDQAKKKKEEEKPSLITARKSYIPSPPIKKTEAKEEVKADPKKEEVDDKKKMTAVRTPGITRPRRNVANVEAEPEEIKSKVDDAKTEVKAEAKKLPTIVKRNEQITKVVEKALTLPTKNNVTASSGPRPVPRLLNTMITPKTKQSPNVKLAGDGTDKKVFSIDLTDDSIKEKKVISSPIKPSPIRAVIAAKENVAINKPQPSALLKNKLESELLRMKASANVARRQQLLPQTRHSLPAQPTYTQNTSNMAARRITKFESWYVIDVKNVEPAPFRHTHTHSLIRLGNNIKDLQLPSSKWDYKVTLQRRTRKENNNEEEDYMGEVNDDKTSDADKANFEPSSILFKRSHREMGNKLSIDRSLMLKQNFYTITMNGKQCKLIGAPDDIKSIEDLEYLLSIIDSSSLDHQCIELVTNNDNIITIS